MKDFNIAKYLRENYQGSFSMFQPYVDLNPLKEESEEQLDTTVPYEGPDPHLDGLGSEYDQVAPVEEAFGEEQEKHDRMMGLAHKYFEKISPIVKDTIDNLRADGFNDQDIIDFLATDFSLENE